VNLKHFLRHQTRGVALAETTIMISFTLLLIFSTMQFGILGYFQVAGDSATFVAAHEYTLGVTQANIKTIEGNMVPHTIASAVTFVPSAPPSIDPSIFTTIYGNINQQSRNSGYTLVRPQNFQVSLQNSNYKGVYGFNSVPISAGAVEGYYLMSSQQMNNAGVGPNDPLSDGSAVMSPSLASPFLPQSDASIYNMNTPPYYLPSAIIMLCPTPFLGISPHYPIVGDLCNGHPWYLGLGEYLSNYNYGQSTMDVNFGGVFQAMAAHQRVYAKLINAFPQLGGAGGGSTPTQAMENELMNMRAEFHNYLDSPLPLTCSRGGTTVSVCGSNYVPDQTMFANGNQPLKYYDPMLYWSYQAAYTDPSWRPQSLWSPALETTLVLDSAGDGPMGPAAWGGASFALVYYWDQGNFPPHPTAPGAYPTHPLDGSQAVGDPGYAP
jgi:hypothetical protein